MSANTSEATSPAPTENPHCEERWPYSIAASTRAGQLIAEATEANYAVVVLADLLHADSGIACDAQDSDDPVQMPTPFTDRVRCGLFSALHVCASTIARNLEHIADAEKAREGAA